MNIAIEDMEKAYADLAGLALQALVENRVDLTIDKCAPPKTRKFLVAAHRSGRFHAEQLKRKFLYRTDWKYGEAGYVICPSCHESMTREDVGKPRNHSPDCEYILRNKAEEAKD